MEATDEKVTELGVALLGTTEKPGALELIRRMSDAVESGKRSLEKITEVVEALKGDRTTFRGIVLGVGVSGAVIGWLLNYVFTR